MTGKELILYILQNNLEDTMVFKDGAFLDMMSWDDAAAKYRVGPATVKVWYERGLLPGLRFGDTVFFRRDAEIKTRGNQNEWIW